jgi:branched-chain amino acid transport system permease protein
MSTVSQAPSGQFELRDSLGWTRTPWLALAVLVLVALLVPLVVSNSYIMNILILILITAILNQAWNLELGMCGIWNFGQLALYALGGYTVGILAVRYGVSPWLGIPIGMLAAGVVNAVLTIPMMRLRGIYGALLTFSFGECFRLTIVNDGSGFTGGTFGLAGVPSLFPGFSPQATQRAYYWLCLVLCFGVALLLKRFMDSPFGVANGALRDSPRYAVGLGVNRRSNILAASVVSALLTGLAGALYATYYSSISPAVMGLTPMSMYCLMIIVGGLGTISGPILGTAVTMFLLEELRVADEWRLIIVMGVLLAMLMVQPRGLVPLFGGLWRRLQKWMNEGEERQPEPE